jgi:hypothetical protein
MVVMAWGALRQLSIVFCHRGVLLDDIYCTELVVSDV